MSLEDINELKKQLELNPDSKIFIFLAKKYMSMNMLDDAISALKDGIQKHPDCMSAHFTLGRAYMEKGRTDDAISEFEMILKYSPDNILTHKKLSKLYALKGETEKARDAYQKALDRDLQIETEHIFLDIQDKRDREKDMNELISKLNSYLYAFRKRKEKIKNA